MAKVSASTLARQAAKTKNPKEAKRLRAAAAKMRREARSVRAPDPVLEARATKTAGIELVFTDSERAASVDHAPLVSKPWYETEDQIVRLMKAAGDPGEFRDQLSMLLSGSRHDARSKAINENADAIKSANEAWAITIVSAFIGQVEAMETMRGGIPKTVLLSGMTVARVVDALRVAGYTSDGKTGTPRWRAVAGR